MLSVFPYLLSYTLAVPLAFRLVLGALFIFFAYRNISDRGQKKSEVLEGFKLKPGHLWLWILALLEAAGGVLLFFGLFTQAAALGLSLMLILALIAKQRDKNSLTLSFEVILLLLLVTLSLLFLGPGFYAVDRPL